MRQERPRQTAGSFFQPPWGGIPICPAGWSAFRGAESAHEIDDKAYQQNQADPAAANDGTTKVKPAAAEQEKQNHHE
jgi:DNA-binding transcriptional regulator of glucitol operon